MNPKQPALFSQPTLNVIPDLKEAMNRAARECGLSREEIVDRMNDLAARYGVSLAAGNGRRLSLETLEKWLNPSELSRVVPAKALPIFCAVAGSAEPLEVLARPLGFRVIGPKETALLEWGRACRRAREARRRMMELDKEIEE